GMGGAVGVADALPLLPLPPGVREGSRADVPLDDASGAVDEQAAREGNGHHSAAAERPAEDDHRPRKRGRQLGDAALSEGDVMLLAKWVPQVLNQERSPVAMEATSCTEAINFLFERGVARTRPHARRRFSEWNSAQ